MCGERTLDVEMVDGAVSPDAFGGMSGRLRPQHRLATQGRTVDRRSCPSDDASAPQAVIYGELFWVRAMFKARTPSSV